MLRTSSKLSSSIDTVLNPPVKEIANLKFSLNIDSSASYTSLTQDPTSVERQLQAVHQIVSEQRIQKIVDGINSGSYPFSPKGFALDSKKEGQATLDDLKTYLPNNRTQVTKFDMSTFDAKMTYDLTVTKENKTFEVFFNSEDAQQAAQKEKSATSDWRY